VRRRLRRGQGRRAPSCESNRSPRSAVGSSRGISARGITALLCRCCGWWGFAHAERCRDTAAGRRRIRRKYDAVSHAKPGLIMRVERCRDGITCGTACKITRFNPRHKLPALLYLAWAIWHRERLSRSSGSSRHCPRIVWSNQAKALRYGRGVRTEAARDLGAEHSIPPHRVA
jgi:hypothetical protein